MKRADLLDLVYRFYPRGLLEGGLGYYDTEERFRQMEAVRRGAAEYPTWKALIRRLGARYEVWDHSLGLLSGSYDPGYWADVRLPGHRIGFHVSLLGPCYGIHRIGAPGEEQAALDLVREIEATYPGYAPIPPELGDEVVPDVVSCGKTTIYECLLSPGWTWSSVPDDGKRSPDYVDPADDPGAEDEAPDPGPDLPDVHVHEVGY